MKNKRVAFVVNTPDFFISHRLPIAIKAKEMGFDVTVISASGDAVQLIKSNGLSHHELPILRSGQNPLKEFWTLLAIIRFFRRLQPDLVHLVTIKPVLYGGLAARVVGIHAVVSAISGLGTVFHSSSGGGDVRKVLIKFLYRLAFKHKRLRVIFQNPEDRDVLLSARAVTSTDVRMIKGSGVDLQFYQALPEPEGKPVIVMAARLLKDKGVVEFVEAAEILKGERGIDIEFRLIGSCDPDNPTSVTETELAAWGRKGFVTLLGYRSDIATQYADANIVCLPSYYGEGLPKTLIEAAACGRAVVTTDHPGCRDAIKPDVSGVLVPVKDSVALADAIQSLVEDPVLRKQMGQAGRVLAEEEFAIEKIVDQHMQIYRDLLEQ